MKDYEIVSIMSEGYGNRFSKALDAVVSAIANKQLDMLNLDAVRSRMEEAFKALEFKVRFDRLSFESKGHLKCNPDGFDLDGHKFETLDDVEHALRNKAFL